MPTQLHNDDIVKVQVYCSQGEQQAINRLMFRAKNLVGIITDKTVVDLMAAVYAPVYKAWMGTLQFYRGLRFQVVRPIPADYVTSVLNAGAGALAGPALPAQTALCVQLKTGVTGRFNRGRTYLPFWDSSLNTGGASAPTNAGLALAIDWTDITTIPQTYADGVGNSITLELIIDSKGRVDPPVVAPHITVVNDYKLDANWATQRRRSRINRPDQFGPA